MRFIVLLEYSWHKRLFLVFTLVYFLISNSVRFPLPRFHHLSCLSLSPLSIICLFIYSGSVMYIRFFSVLFTRFEGIPATVKN